MIETMSAFCMKKVLSGAEKAFLGDKRKLEGREQRR